MGDRRAVEKIEEARADLEALADRDDLRMSKYARALLDVADAEG